MGYYDDTDDRAYRGKHARKLTDAGQRPQTFEGHRITADHPETQAASYDYDAFNRRIEEHKLKRRKSGKRNKALIAIGAVLLAIILAAALFLAHINSVMALDPSKDRVGSTLTETSLDQPFYMLLVGSDWREDSGITSASAMSGDQQRADIMMLARIDRKGNLVTLLTIPRDTPYRTEDGAYEKLNEVYNQGRGAALVPAVESIVGVPISHYAEIYFSDFETLVDALDGIVIDVPMDITGTDMLTGETVSVSAGRQTIDGAQAGLIARERKIYGDNQDANRQSAIRSIVQAMVAKARKASVSQFPAIISGAAGCLRTDLNSTELIYLMSGFYDGVTMYNGTGPYAGSIDDAAGGLWLCYEDPEGWGRVMNVVDSGGDPSEVSYSGDIGTIAGTDITVVVD